MISIIIPAHNEAKVIRACLEQVTSGLEPGEAEVIVVCNGCSDDTAGIAGTFGSPVRMIETDVPSKVNALNLGDEAATGFPRIYMDADIRLDGQAIRRLADVLKKGPCLAAALHGNGSGPVQLVCPCLLPDLERVALYAGRIHGRRRLRHERGGTAAFRPLPRRDRRRRVRANALCAGERVAAPECVSIVKGPATLRDLIKIKTRSRLGLYQLRRRFPELFAREAALKQYGRASRWIAANPLLWPAAAVYVCVNLISKHRARRQMGRIEQYVWERDESSRVDESPSDGRAPQSGTPAAAATNRGGFGGNRS